jgi:hypothetical protein
MVYISCFAMYEQETESFLFPSGIRKMIEIQIFERYTIGKDKPRKCVMEVWKIGSHTSRIPFPIG